MSLKLCYVDLWNGKVNASVPERATAMGITTDFTSLIVIGASNVKATTRLVWPLEVKMNSIAAFEEAVTYL